jgi:hypothetical protein
MTALRQIAQMIAANSRQSRDFIFGEKLLAGLYFEHGFPPLGASIRFREYALHGFCSNSSSVLFCSLRLKRGVL